MINTIDQDKCTGCGTCFKSCSLDVFRLNTDQRLVSPCMAACPAGIDIRAYNALVQEGKLEEAADKLKEANPFPAITGRICFHPCEQECSRNAVDDAVNINALEQFLGDLMTHDHQPVIRHTAKVAIVGSGPAGLSCALFLARLGYPVTVFEALPHPGGMLRYGIPAYRLPDAIVEAQVRRLEHLGVRFRCNTRVGQGGDVTLDDLRKRGFKAFLLAPGTGLSRRLAIEGTELPGVLWGVAFLRAIRSDRAPTLSGNVVVVGGGDVAVDAAISAKRLGAASVSMVSLESAAELPAYPHNQADAREEGILFEFGWGPARIEGTEQVTGLTVKRCLSVTDASGNFHPLFDENQLRTLAADTVIFAIGQTADLKPFVNDVEITPRTTIKTIPITFETSAPDIFAAGDASSGPASAIQAIAGGREAAFSIDRALRGSQILANRGLARAVTSTLPGEGMLPVQRNERHAKEVQGFAERHEGFTLHEALAESMRCMTCGAKARIAYTDDCMTCFTCELRCPSGAINVHPFKEPLPRTLEIQCEEK